jgi:hypothetical protein
MGKPGRRKKVIYTRIALEIRCEPEYCGPCRFLEIKDKKCFFWKRNLSTSVINDVENVDRCSSCLMAERVANGESTE